MTSREAASEEEASGTGVGEEEEAEVEAAEPLLLDFESVESGRST